MKSLLSLFTLLFLFVSTTYGQYEKVDFENLHEEKLHEKCLHKKKSFKPLQKNTYKGAANEQDSLALVALYNTTGGENWTHNENWLTGNVATWDGVYLDETGRVVRIYLTSNNLTGSIPTQIGNLTKLTDLSLYYNQLTGSIPTQIGNLTKLTSLSLYGNQLTASIPTQIGNLTKLTSLHLWDNQLTGSIPTQIGNLTNLTHLVLFRNRLTGSIPAEIGNLTNLYNLDLCENQLTGSIPNEIGNLTNLDFLDLRINQLNGSIPTQIGNLTNLAFLLFGENELTGSIPTQIENLTNLACLDLEYNQLTGTIPTQIGNLTKLGLLELGYNQLTGSIPTEIGNLTNLDWLYLGGNKLTGSIPTEIGNLTKLLYLKLECNKLTGSIPTQIGNLTKLKELIIYNNHLTGSIPAEIGNLTNLTGVDLYDNNFDFGDLEAANISFDKFNYSPQAKIPVTHTEENNQITFTFNTGGSNNQYQWIKDDTEITGETTNTLTISNTEAGSYWCKITDPNFPDLTLETEIYIKINATANITEAGTITGTDAYKTGDTVTLTATPNENYKFVNWTANGREVSTDATYSFTVLNAYYLARTFVANFEAIGQNVEITATANLTEGGTITGNKTYEIGATAELVATTNENYNFVNWTEAGTEVSTETTYSFTVSEARTLVANFKLGYNVNQQDSLALVALYNATDGENWKDNTNWLTGNLSTWDGVYLNGTGRVVRIHLASNNLTGSIPAEIGNLTNLKFLFLMGNKLTGSIPAEIGNLTNLEHLYLDYNQLTSIPAEIGNLNNLKYLNLDYNQLTSIPVEIGNLSNLEELHLHDNELTGSIPAGICNLTNLKRLRIAHNQLTSIPAEIGNLINLTELSLHCCKLTGSIPTQIGNLTKLTKLFVGHNQLTGSIPAEIGNLTNLTNFDLYDNYFDFGDLEAANISFDNFLYSPQAKIPVTRTEENNQITFSFNVGGSNNQYQWIKDDTEITGETTNTLTIANTESGAYWCKITDTNFPDLTLETEIYIKINATANITEAGTITGTDAYKTGDTVTLTATPNENYKFVNWTANGREVSTEATYSFTVLDAYYLARTFVANFEAVGQNVEISATANPTEGGTITGNQTYEIGATATLKATPNEGYIFVNWTENRTEVSKEATFSFTVSEARTLVANFKLDNAAISDENTNSEIKLYPNPAKDIVTIQYEDLKNAKLSLFDFAGKKQNIKILNKNSNQIQIDISDKKAGVYFLQILIDNKIVKTSKIVVIK